MEPKRVPIWRPKSNKICEKSIPERSTERSAQNVAKNVPKMEAQHPQNQGFRLRRFAVLHFCSLCKKVEKRSPQNYPKILPNWSRRPSKSDAKKYDKINHQTNAQKANLGAKIVPNGFPKWTGDLFELF